MVVARGGMRRNWELLLNGDRASVWEDEKVLEKDGGGCTTIWMYLMLLNCTLKMANSVVNGRFYVMGILLQ